MSRLPRQIHRRSPRRLPACSGCTPIVALPSRALVCRASMEVSAVMGTSGQTELTDARVTARAAFAKTS